jgi:alginate biosynthesis protein AlgX
MLPDQEKYISILMQALCVGFIALATATGADAAHSQTAYACNGLETQADLPVVEGHGGTFFAIRPELQAHNALGEETIVLLSDLHNALEAHGTKLVLLPVPTRAQVLIDQLPAMAGHLGFDVDASTAVHMDMIRRLRKAGLTVADPLSDLRASARSGARPFFETDPRPTAEGARILAGAVGAALADHGDLADLTRGVYRSTAGAEVTLSSIMRAQIQLSCQSELPTVTTQSFTTTRDMDSSNGSTNPSKATSDDLLVVLGTDITGTPELNLSGFLSEATGLDVLEYGVNEGGAFAAMSSYLTSVDFQEAPPRVLVWEFPVSVSMSDHGDQPLRELVAAAANSCGRSIPLIRTPAGDRLRAELGQFPLDANNTLELDTDGALLSFVRFHFTGADGLVRSRSIYRQANQLLTGRFYLSLAGMNTTGLRAIEIEAPAAFGLQSSLAVCS